MAIATTMSSTSTTAALASLPTETIQLVLSFCDAQTLGRACLASLAFLELAGPLLYRHVTITGFDQLERMFYNDTRVSSAPHLDPHLSLDQALTFTFLGVSSDASRMFEPERSKTRCELHSQLFQAKRTSCSFPLRVHTLNATFHCPEPQREQDIADIVTGSIFDLFDPVHVSLRSQCRPGVPPLCVGLETVKFKRIRKLEVDEIEWWFLLAFTDFVRQLRRRSLALSYNLAGKSDEARGFMVEKFLEDLGGIDGREGALLAGEREQIEEVVFKIGSGNEEEDLRERMRDKWDAHGVAEDEQGRQSAMIRFVVV